MSSAPEDAPGGAPGRTPAWDTAWAQREALLKIARRRSASPADAEDAVSEAITRSAETDELDHDRMGPWLTAVTTRLCVDEARERAREPRRIAYQIQQGMTAEDHGDAVCDRAEAGWLAGHLSSLPERQGRALELRAHGLEVAGIAEAMGISDKAAEGLLQRARAALRQVLSSALGWIGLVLAAVIGTVRRRTVTGATAIAAAGISTVLGVLHLPTGPAEAGPDRGSTAVVPAPGADSRETDDQRPPAPATQPAAPAVVPDRTAPTVTRPAAAPAPAPAATKPARATVIPPQDLSTDGFVLKSGGVTQDKSDETLPQRVERCLRDGPVVSTTLIGCRPKDENP